MLLGGAAHRQSSRQRRGTHGSRRGGARSRHRLSAPDRAARGGSLAVVIPTLNEARHLPTLLDQLAQQRDIALQVFVADGGSSDETVAIARKAGATIVEGARGRGAQMNAGARAASAKQLLFLHADSQLIDPRLLATALAAWQGDRVAGHFPLRFADGAVEHAAFYRYLEGKTRMNRPFTINGDQGLLISRRFFDELGGFDESLPFLEDQRIAAKIFARGRWIVLPGELITSARRFETEGVVERYTLMAITMGLFAGGAEDFFAGAPKLYATPSGRLDLRAQLQAVEAYLQRLGFAQRWRLLLRIGAFIRDNAWQLAYRGDVLRNDGALRSLDRFERWLRPLLANPAASALGAVLARAWLQRLRRSALRPTSP